MDFITHLIQTNKPPAYIHNPGEKDFGKQRKNGVVFYQSRAHEIAY
jgi:hypothetical protein